MLDFLNAHKTKLLGIGLIIVTFVQGDAGLVNLMSETAYAWTIRVAGVLALIFGYLNTQAASDA